MPAFNIINISIVFYISVRTIQITSKIGWIKRLTNLVVRIVLSSMIFLMQEVLIMMKVVIEIFAYFQKNHVMFNN